MPRKPTAPQKPQAKARRTRTRDWKPDFLTAFEQTGTVVQAARAAGIDRMTAYRARQADEDFAIAWADVEEKVTETLERVALQRAIDGSDRLIEFLLKARRPDRYRENTVKVEHSGRIGHDLEGMDDDQLRRVAQGLEALP